MQSGRNCWPVLADKARDAVTQRKQELSDALARVEQLQASRARLMKLHDDYSRREAQAESGITTGAGMHHQANHRQFMAQLLALRQRVDQDIERAQSVVAQQRARLVDAEVELRKMEALVEGDRRAVHAARDKQEQRQIDAIATAQFNAQRLAAKA